MGARRSRAALAGAAVLAGVVPAVAVAYAPAFRCRDVENVGSWQRIPIQKFEPIVGINSTDAVTSYSVAPNRPQYVVVTNGKRIQVSEFSGCAWNNGLALGLQPTGDAALTGTSSTIVSTAVMPGGRVLAAVREGTGPASRPHILGSDNGRDGYRSHDSGLPPQGAPRFLEAAADGHTVYLVLTPSSGGDDGTLPGVPEPTNPVAGGKAGLLYASTDAGRTWSLRTKPTDLPAGGGGLDRLAIDPQNPNRLYAVSGGLLLFSLNGGRTFLRAMADDDDVTAVETGLNGQVFAFTAGGLALFSTDGRSFAKQVSRAGVTSAAYRRGDGHVAVENNGTLALLDPRTGQAYDVRGLKVTKGSLVGDVSEQASYHALSGHSLVRYADPPLRGRPPPVTVGDLGVPPPPAGRISPATRTVQLKVGTSTVVDYGLALPKSPTPLDLMFLVDTSGSMSAYINNLKANINKVTQAVQSAGIDLQVGVATLGSGPLPDESIGPYFDPSNPDDRGPQLYELLRRIGPIDAEFGSALARVQVKEPRSGAQHEAQLAALEQATAGLGIKDKRSTAALPLYIVPPGQGAQWRPAPSIRRLIVHATDEQFDSPEGSPMKNGRLDFAHTIALMNEYHVQQIGLTVGSPDSEADLARVASGTTTLAPAGGADCGQGVVLKTGRPVVCVTEGDFSVMIGRLVRSLADRQSVILTARGPSAGMVRPFAAPNLRNIDVTVPNELPFRVAVSCEGQSVGRYLARLDATLREVTVASGRLTVDCVGPAAAVAAPPVAPPAPPAPLAQPPAVAPAPPAPQPQGQPQAQPQPQPMTVAAMQQQEELQLALALQADEESIQTDEQLAMVGRRRPADHSVLVLLVAMTACTALGLSRLRSRPDPEVARAHVPR